MKYIVFTVVTLFLLVGIMGFVLAEGNSSSPTTSSNESQPCSTCGNNSSSPSNCGKLIYFCSDNSPYCTKTMPEVDKYIQDSGCVEVQKYIIPRFEDLVNDNLAKQYHIDFVPAFVFINNKGCSYEIGAGGGTTVDKIKEAVSKFECGGSNIFITRPATPTCPSYTCDGGYAPKCEIINNQCSCESCPAKPVDKCGKLIYFCSDDSPYCTMTAPEVDKFTQNSGCVEVTKHIISTFMNLDKDALSLQYKIQGVPTFLFIDENGCSGDIGKGGNTKVADIRNGVNNFKCGSNSSSPYVPPTPTCPSYTCEGYKPKCSIVNNQCSCESCPAVLAPNATSGPIEIPTTETPVSEVEKTLYVCQGCELDSKCYPFGFRKDKNYCNDVTSTFISQKVPNTSCENSFECDSNLCVNNQCVSGSLWQKIMNWFSKLFGGK